MEDAEKRKVTDTKVRKRRYTLEELLEGSDYMRELGAQERAWETAPPVGREIF